MKLLAKNLLVICLMLEAIGTTSIASMGDDPVLTKVMSEVEYLPGAADGALEWDLDAWAGRDLYKVWLKTSGEYSGSEIEQADIEIVFSRAAYTNWDQQFGVRRDLKPDPANGADKDLRDWVSFGYVGMAPYFVAVDARLYVGEESSTQILIELEREIMLTQEWVLTPELDIIANGKTNPDFAEGSGLSEIEFSLRLGYERNGNRKFQPFISITAVQTFGGTRRFAKAEGNNSGSIEGMIGIHSWF